VTGENRVFEAEHITVLLVRHKSHVDWLEFGAGLRDDCLNHTDRDTLLHCYIATTTICNCRRSQHCCPSVSTTHIQILIIFKDGQFKISASKPTNNKICGQDKLSADIPEGCPPFGFRSGPISEKHRQCRAFA
jgi:hypothetical protein